VYSTSSHIIYELMCYIRVLSAC